MDFSFVQRLSRALGHAGAITQPSHLQADYMGSSEFEFGALPKSYKTMAQQSLVQTTVTVAAFDTETIFHVIASADQVASLQERFQIWFDRDLRGQEPSYLDRVITRTKRNKEPMSDEEFNELPVAWWDINRHVFFSLDESIAKMWLNALQAPGAAVPGP